MIKIGDMVRMTDEFKQRMTGTESEEHIREFGNCIGEVIGPMFPNTSSPELNIRWKLYEASNLIYGYNPNDLEIVK